MSQQGKSQLTMVLRQGYTAKGGMNHVGYFKRCLELKRVILDPKPPSAPMTLSAPGNTVRVYAHAEYVLWVYLTLLGRTWDGMDQVDRDRKVDLYQGEETHVITTLDEALDLFRKWMKVEVQNDRTAS